MKFCTALSSCGPGSQLLWFAYRAVEWWASVAEEEEGPFQPRQKEARCCFRYPFPCCLVSTLPAFLTSSHSGLTGTSLRWLTKWLKPEIDCCPRGEGRGGALVLTLAWKLIVFRPQDWEKTAVYSTVWLVFTCAFCCFWDMVLYVTQALNPNPLASVHWVLESQIPHWAPKCMTLTSQRPYIVYMLQDLDILEDWTTIRKVWLTNGTTEVYSYSQPFRSLFISI